jgi:D-alanine-D-alanine ligase-like ATP-grasp enzyme
MNIGLIFGGRSVEHVISIISARNVVAAIDKSRFQLSLIGSDIIVITAGVPFGSPGATNNMRVVSV